MSNAISFDPLLTFYLARELHGRMAGRVCRALPHMGEGLAVTLPLERGEALRLDLHPTRGWIRILAQQEEGETEGESEVVCVGVTCPPDERRLEISLRESGRFRVQEWRLVLELHTNQWNALLLDGETARIVAVLRPRDAGDRSLRPGARYAPPPARSRYDGGSDSPEEGWTRWREVLASTPLAERTRVVVREFAYTGSLNAPAILGEALQRAEEPALRAAFERWWRIRALPPPSPVLLRLPTGAHPYPLPLPGVPAERLPSLLAGMDRVASTTAPDPGERERETALLVEAARRRQQAAARRSERIRERLADAGEAERMRGYGDLLLAHLHQVPRAAEAIRLRDWEGGEVEIPLDPALSPAENAARWYDRARRHTRARDKLPALLAQAEAEAQRWEKALQLVEEGGVLAAWAVAELEREPARHGAGRKREENTLPYRRYRTSGGLEARVGRSSKDNDRLTFGFSSPGDIWLHARSVPGSHVILRWPDPEANPPARDLAEAAGLAALFSKARTSGLVAVDWTRRKYVRKPRGAPPGAVIPQRVKTLFVEPDAELEERLRERPE